MKEKLYEIRSEFHTFYTDRCGNGGTGLSVYYPKEKTPRSQIAVIAMHPGGYMGFSPMIEMAKRGFIAAGVMQRQRHVDGWLREYKTCIDKEKCLRAWFSPPGSWYRSSPHHRGSSSCRVTLCRFSHSSRSMAYTRVNVLVGSAYSSTKCIPFFWATRADAVLVYFM